MQERHFHRDKYFEEQAYTSKHYVIPFIEEVMKLDPGMEVLEIGCGEGGNLRPFLEIGLKATGVDLLESKIENAKKIYRNYSHKNNLTLVCEDIYDVGDRFDHRFDVIIMRDVLEHIHNHEKFLHYVKRFLKPRGKFFLGFPPWQNPFGGHQQMCQSRLLSKTPFLHLLPGKLYPATMKLFGEAPGNIINLLEIRDTRITIEKFRKLIRLENYQVKKEVFWFINPNYEIKFRLKPRKQSRLISSLPFFRNFMITTCYYVLEYNPS
ncbi:MAG TPA: class I SAM-dependent methyltransferase [Bacteroidales bacterium]|nr:class I SAM-dependent methyltransferase [Bacteroidales bacterium]